MTTTPHPTSEATTSEATASATTASDDNGSGDDDPARYLEQVMADIDAEVRRRRASGDLPASLERQLDELFLEFSPVGLQGRARLRETLALVDGSAYVDIAVPTASNKAVGSYLKRLIKKSISWYLNFVAVQIIKFQWACSRMFHTLVEHIEALESGLDAHRTPDLPANVRPTVDQAGTWWAATALDALSGTPGRVVVGECGTGSLVEALVDAGIDAYGVDPSEAGLEGALERGADVRAEEVLDHLEVVADEALGGLVLTGAVERLRPHDRERLVDLVATRLTVGGMVILHSATPEAWARSSTPVLRDLAPGHPLHAETWTHLLETKGFAVRPAVLGAEGSTLAHVAGDRPDARELNATIDMVNMLVGGPGEYVVTAVRQR